MRWQIATLLGTTFEALSAMDGPISAGKSRKNNFQKVSAKPHEPSTRLGIYARSVSIESRLRRRSGTRQQFGHQKKCCMPME
jgi:hypothetical protein